MSPGLLLGVMVVVLAQGTDVQRHIVKLSAFDYDVRTRAARLLRRAPAAEAAPALAAIASEHDTARAAILRLGAAAGGRLREEAAVALSSVALRRTNAALTWAGGLGEADRSLTIDLLREGFDRLEENFAEEQFVAAARAAYWNANEGSPARTVAAALIDRLEF